MSEINLAALAESDKKEEHVSKLKTPMEEINIALKECTLGLFHVQLMITSFFGVMSGVLVTSSTSFLLPSAECDLNMDLVQKGTLNAAPYFGMLFSSLIAGFLTDTFGRKKFILIGLGGIFLSTIVCGLSQSFIVLLIGKICEGCLFAVAFNPIVTLTSEFCHSEVRDRLMLCQSSCIASSQCIIALFSWAILTHDLRYTLFGGYIVLNTWNFYQLFCSLFSLTAFILYALLPESPKYLLTQKRYDETRDVLIKIYRTNTRKPANTYPCINIWREKSKDNDSEDSNKGLLHQIVVGLHNMKPLFRKPLSILLSLLCASSFLCMFLYNVLRLWFPQLSTIMESYTLDSNQDLCELLDLYTYDLSKAQNLTVSAGTNSTCIGKIGTQTFINSLIISLVCILPFIISGSLVNIIGKKKLLLIGGVLTIASTLGVRWTTSKALFLALFGCALALTQSMVSLFQATVVENVPTTARTLAISMIMVSGRTGTLIGNVVFPILLKKKCEVPFFTMASFMAVVVFMIIFFPAKKITK